ncbi:STAS domain-containing protein [Candidatus Dependentiae bacterium]|nr:STAS domain-containing protein [Candidatus Dependentiae bacterium]
MAEITIKSGLNIDDYCYKKITVVEFTGSITEQNLYPIKETLISKFNTFCEYVAFDLAKVPFISTETFKELIDLNKKLRMLNKKIYLTHLQKPVFKFLSNTAIMNIFKICENEEQVFQEYCAEKNVSEDDIEVFSPGNKLNKWYNKIQKILLDLKEQSGSAKFNFIPEDANNNLSVIIISRSLVLGRGLNEIAGKYKLTPYSIGYDSIQDTIGKAENLAGYIIDGYGEFNQISSIITKIRNAESDFCKSLLPVMVSLRNNMLEANKIMKLNEMIYYIVDDSIDRESKIIKKIRNLYENIDKVVIYLTLSVKFEITTEICNFVFTNKVSTEDAELFDAFLSDDFVNNLLKDMFTINFNYYDCKEADDLFFTTIENISKKYEQCVHFITKQDCQLNSGLKNIPFELNVNVL